MGDNKQDMSGNPRKEGTTGKELPDNDKAFEEPETAVKRAAFSAEHQKWAIPATDMGWFSAGWDAHAELVKPLIEAARAVCKAQNEFAPLAEPIYSLRAALDALTNREGEK